MSNDDHAQIKRILLQCCPFSLKFQEYSKNKFAAIARGNQKNFVQNKHIVMKALNKEDRNSHLVPMHDWVCHLSPNMRHNPQGLVLKLGSNPRVVWDGTTCPSPNDVVMNEITPTEDEPDVTFGMAKILFYQYLYNLRVSFPTEVIFLALADIKACFRYPRIHPDLTGAFGFLVDDLYCLAVAMVFGSNTSSSSWEPFRRAIEKMSLVFSSDPTLVEKHKHYLNMIKWDIPPSDAEPPVKAFKCQINPGVLDPQGKQVIQRPRIWVDDALMAAIGVLQMKMVLASII